MKVTEESILELSRGFMASRVLLSAAELDLFTRLADAPMTAQQAANACGAELRGMTILLDALAALGLMEKTAGRYRTAPKAAPLLSSRAPESILPMVLHMATVWRNWSEITDIVRGATKPSLRRKGALAEENRRAFIGAMHVVASRAAAGVVAAIAPGSARRLLDVGGGPGTYTLAMLQASPEMTATLFDLPAVVEMAREPIQAAGLLDRVVLAAGDFYTDELPAGHDLALLSAIIHQNSPEQNAALYAKVFRALAPRGRIVVRDHVMAPDRTQPLEGALFAVNMLAGTDGGRTYTFAEIRQGLEEAGFFRIRQLQDKGMLSLVEGFKP
jgi:predicted O-methyltransferase YrrM